MVLSSLIGLTLLSSSIQEPNYIAIASHIREALWALRLDSPIVHGLPPRLEDVHDQHAIAVSFQDCWILLRRSNGKILYFSAHNTEKLLSPPAVPSVSKQHATRIVKEVAAAGGFEGGLHIFFCGLREGHNGFGWDVQGSHFIQGYPWFQSCFFAEVHPMTGALLSFSESVASIAIAESFIPRQIHISPESAKQAAFAYISARSNMQSASAHNPPLLCWWLPRDSDDSRFEPLPAYFAELGAQNRAVLMYKVTFDHGTRCWSSDGMPIYCEAYVDPQTGQVASATVADFGYGGGTASRTKQPRHPWPSVPDEPIDIIMGQTRSTVKGDIDPVSETIAFEAQHKLIVGFRKTLIAAEYDSSKNRVRTQWNGKWVYGRPSSTVARILKSAVAKELAPSSQLGR